MGDRKLDHCKHGHEFTPDNTWYTRTGGRRCRECQRLRNRQWKSRQATGRPPGRPVVTEDSRRQRIAWVDLDALWELVRNPDPKQRWRDWRNCRPEHTDWFFTERTPEGARLRKKAADLCAGCPVRVECLAASIHDQWAYVGGTSANDRKVLRVVMYEHLREEVA
jgi:hypothetical protein